MKKNLLQAIFLIYKIKFFVFENPEKWNTSLIFCSKIRKNGTQVSSFVRKSGKMEHKSHLLFENLEK
jgi:hypothetical protein